MNFSTNAFQSVLGWANSASITTVDATEQTSDSVFDQDQTEISPVDNHVCSRNWRKRKLNSSSNQPPAKRRRLVPAKKPTQSRAKQKNYQLNKNASKTNSIINAQNQASTTKDNTNLREQTKQRYLKKSTYDAYPERDRFLRCIETENPKKGNNWTLTPSFISVRDTTGFSTNEQNA